MFSRSGLIIRSLPLPSIGGVGGGVHPSLMYYCRRPFASSSDDTNLLQDASIHCFTAVSGHLQYVLVPRGMDSAVQKDPQLHLARLYRDGNTLYGAKVVNPALGSPKQVCGKLVDAALEDIGSHAAAQARSTLHGLSDYVRDLLNGGKYDDGGKTAALLAEMSAIPDAQKLASGDIINSNELSGDEKIVWELLARMFTGNCPDLATEAALYESTRALMASLLFGADTSEFANTCGGAMALYRFKMPLDELLTESRY